MRVLIRVTSGPFQGRCMLLRSGQALKFGRTEWADFAFPHDAQMSSTHFEVEYDGQQCLVRDLQSTNGTIVGGHAISQQAVQDGDTILAGQTTFVVEISGVTQTGDIQATVRVPPQRPVEPAANLSAKSSDPADSPTPVAASSANAARPKGDRGDAIPAGLPLPYQAGWQDAAPHVRRAALQAAAWTRQPWLLDFCRRQARRPSWEVWPALSLLAILGKPDDQQLIMKLGRDPALGVGRFQVLSSYGHPHVIPELLQHMQQADAAAAAAAIAFWKITGVSVAGQERIEFPEQDVEQLDQWKEHAPDEGFLPDVARAQEFWTMHQDRFLRGTRWRQGIDLSPPTQTETFQILDMEGRWQAYLRARYEGHWHGNPAQLDR